MFLAIDPGKSKCGMALLDKEKNILLKKIVLTEEIFDEIKSSVLKYNGIKIIIGNGTTSKDFCRRLLVEVLDGAGGDKDQLVLVEEAYTTVEGRKRYWLEHPPRGWRRLIPLSWLTIPRPVDDYVAVILAERYIEKGKTLLL